VHARDAGPRRRLIIRNRVPLARVARRKVESGHKNTSALIPFCFECKLAPAQARCRAEAAGRASPARFSEGNSKEILKSGEN